LGSGLKLGFGFVDFLEKMVGGLDVGQDCPSFRMELEYEVDRWQGFMKDHREREFSN
jgi:hypothetical protein